MVVSPPALASGRRVHEVVMHLLAAAEMDLFEQAGVEEMLEGAINRGLGDAVLGFPQFQQQFLGLEGPAKRLHGLEDRQALRGILEAALPEELAEEMFGTLHR